MTKPVYKRSENYGQWRQREIVADFNPLPKRECIEGDHTLRMRTFPLDVVSKPYDKAVESPEAKLLRQSYDERMEQPDGGDFADYEPFDE